MIISIWESLSRTLFRAGVFPLQKNSAGYERFVKKQYLKRRPFPDETNYCSSTPVYAHVMRAYVYLCLDPFCNDTDCASRHGAILPTYELVFWAAGNGNFLANIIKYLPYMDGMGRTTREQPATSANSCEGQVIQ